MKKHQRALLPLLMAVVFALCPCLTVRAEGEGGAALPDETASAMLSALSRAAQADLSPKAKQVGLSVTGAGSGKTYAGVTDGDEGTYVAFGKGGTLRITSEQAFENLYLQLELPCQWTLTLPDGTALSGGKNGFIHEYMPLGQAVKSAELTLPKEAMLTDIYAFTDGKPPAWVQVWEPPCEKADLLVLPTHADDEHLWFGGAMPYYAGELEYEVQVVYLTNHDNTTYRNHERLNGLWTVGVTHYPVIGKFRDVLATKASLEAAQNRFGYNNVLQFQVETLRRFSPRVVIAHDINGEYGHGAHRLNAKTLLDALALTDDPTAFPKSAEKYGTCRVQKCYLHLWKQNKIVVDWDSMILAHFDGKTALDMAKAGFACHESQTKWFSVEDSGAYDCRLFGLAYTTVGDDTEGANDMFEHVDWSDKRVREADAVGQDADAEPSDGVRVSDSTLLSASDKPSGGGVSADAKIVLLAVIVVIMVISTVAVCLICFKQRR